MWFATDKIGGEPKFKDEIQADCEAFKIIRSASNAIKHIERKDDGFIVKSINDIQAGKGLSPHTWFHTRSLEPSISITVRWNYDAETQEYIIVKKGKAVKTLSPESNWKTQYLTRLYQPAIDAIDKKLTGHPATNPVQNPNSC